MSYTSLSDTNRPNNTDSGTQTNQPAPSSTTASQQAGIPIIAHGAQCSCDGASSSDQVSLNVISQNKILVNGGTIRAATVNDQTLASLNFGSCRKLNNTACIAAITWQNPYTNVKLEGLQILTMQSYATCSKGGQIRFTSSGQSENISPATTQDIIGLETSQGVTDNTMLTSADTENDQSSISEFNTSDQSESTILETLDPIIQTEAGSGSSKSIDSIQPITYVQQKQGATVKQPKNQQCSFKAASTGSYTWKVRNQAMSVIKEETGKAGQITVRFPRTGRYVIECYRDSSFVKNQTTIDNINTSPTKYKNALIVEVVDNEIQLKADVESCPVYSTVNVTSKKLFDTLGIDAGQLTYRVLSNGIPLTDPNTYTLTETADGLRVIFKKKGTYTIDATSSRGVKVNPTQLIEVKPLLVEEVRINSESNYKARKGENLELKAKLNYESAENQQKIKWEVYYAQTADASKQKIHPVPGAPSINNKPPLNLFSELGFYDVYAFCGNSKAESVKAVVEFCQPKYICTKWKDLNGNTVQEVGKREAVYANIELEGVSGLELKVEVFCLENGNLVSQSARLMTSNNLVYTLKPSQEALDKLSDGHKLYTKVSVKNTNVALIHKDKDPKEYPIKYTVKEKITSIAFYADRDCKNMIASATYGNIIYARVLTRNLTGKALRLCIIRKMQGEDRCIHNITVFKSKQEVTLEGDALFKITISRDWKNDKTSDFYTAFVLEDDDDFWKTGEFLTRNTTAKNSFEINTNLQFLHLRSDNSSPIGQNQTISTVNQTATSSSSSNCPRCNNEITIEQMKQIFPDCLDDRRLRDCMITYNDYMQKLGMNSCWNKAHFFAQARVEVGLSLNIKKAESLNYSTRHLLVGIYTEGAKNWKKGNIQTREGGYFQEGTKFSRPKFTFLLKPENKHYAEELGRKDLDRNNDKGIQACQTEKLTNLVYADENRLPKHKLGNTQQGDGWRFRGRGMIQLTGRENYTKVYSKIKDISPTNILTDEGALDIERKTSLAVLTSMGFWNLYGLDVKANKNKNVQSISKIVGADVHWTEKEKSFNEVTSVLFNVAQCQCGEMNHVENDLKIEKGIAWLKSISITQQEVKNGIRYKVPYVQDGNRVLESGEDTMDCSELVGRYMEKIEWCSKPMGWGTAFMYDFARRHPEWLKKHDDTNYKPQQGDIFLWANLTTGTNGHTGIVIAYDNESDIVTTIEAIRASETPYGESDNISFKGVTELRFKRNARHLLGHKTTNNKGDTISPCRFYTPQIHRNRKDKTVND